MYHLSISKTVAANRKMNKLITTGGIYQSEGRKTGKHHVCELNNLFLHFYRWNKSMPVDTNVLYLWQTFQSSAIIHDTYHVNVSFLPRVI